MRPLQMKTALAVVLCLSVIGLGCAKEIHVTVPSEFHGHVHLQCGGLMTDTGTTLKVPMTGTLDDITCPARQGKLLVSNTAGQPLDVHEKWVTTGDGLVREIDFDVP